MKMVENIQNVRNAQPERQNRRRFISQNRETGTIMTLDAAV